MTNPLFCRSVGGASGSRSTSRPPRCNATQSLAPDLLARIPHLAKTSDARNLRSLSFWNETHSVCSFTLLSMQALRHYFGVN